MTNQELTEKKADNTVIGNVEDDTTASQAYAVGEHFIRSGKFCTVIAAISNGATLTLNTNYIEGTVAEWLKTVDVTSEFTFSDDITWINRTVRKCGNCISVFMRFTTPSTQTANTHLVGIPAKYAPFLASGEVFYSVGSLAKKWSGEASGLLNVTSSNIVANEYQISTEVIGIATYYI